MNRIYGLDVYRAAAILLVVFFHGNFMLQPLLPGFPYVKLPDGVELFFVLSGFLIGTLLLRATETKQSFGWNDLFTFWKRRWFRTLPNYYLLLLVHILFAYQGWNNCDATQVSWKFFFFLHNFSDTFHSFFWESWSLSVEEWFYIFLPLTFGLCFFLLRKWLRIRYVFLLTLLLLILLPLLYRIWTAPDLHPDKFWFDLLYRKRVVMRLDSIVYGVLGAYLCFYHPVLWKRCRYPAFLAGIVLLFSLLYLRQPPDSFFSKVWYFPLTSIACLLLLPLAYSIRTAKRRIGKVFTYLSKVSYAWYLVHLGLVAAVFDRHLAPFAPWPGLLLFLAYVLVSLGLATLVYRYYEKPMTDLRDR